MKAKHIILVFFLLCHMARAQNHEELRHYYPDLAPWPLEFSVDVHVMQCTAENPRNFVPADTPRIHEYFALINQMYNTLDSAYLKVPGVEVPYFRESNIRFKLRKIHFHVDSLGWNSQWMEPAGLTRVQLYDPTTRTIMVRGKNAKNYMRPEGIYLEYANNKGRKIHCDTAYTKDNSVYIKVKENIDTAGISRIGYYIKQDDNCSDDNYRQYGANNSYSIHVFFTESSASEVGYGCGPSKNYLNLANAYRGGPWVVAQMLSHELGHCLGLSHTNLPQFPDLPPTDKFGWLACDHKEVSNNIMGYNICRSYLSPMQIGHVHQQFNYREDYINLTTNRLYDPHHQYTVRGKTELNRHLVINGDLLVKKNSRLVVTHHLFVHEQSKIILEDGAQIEVRGGRITVMNNGKNANVVYCRKFGSPKKPKQKGEIKTTNNGKIVGLEIP